MMKYKVQIQFFGGRGGGSGMSGGSNRAALSQGDITRASGVIGNNQDGTLFGGVPGAHSNASGTTYFGMNTSEQQLVDFVQNSNFVTEGNVKSLGFDVVGSVIDPNYPGTGNTISAHVSIRDRGDGTFDVSLPRSSGTQIDKTYKSESSAMKGGKLALVNFIKKQYGSNR